MSIFHIALYSSTVSTETTTVSCGPGRVCVCVCPFTCHQNNRIRTTRLFFGCSMHGEAWSLD
jgi:hypothetical protein